MSLNVKIRKDTFDTYYDFLVGIIIGAPLLFVLHHFVAMAVCAVNIIQVCAHHQLAKPDARRN